MMDQKLYLAPISENVQNVLDIGTGTGLWAIEFGTIISIMQGISRTNIAQPTNIPQQW